MGADQFDVWSLTELVAYNKDNPSSIVSSVNSARENTRGAREVVSTEMWNAVAERETYARTMGPHAFFSFVEERAAMFAGLVDSTTVRDVGEAMSQQYFHVAPWVAWTNTEVG